MDIDIVGINIGKAFELIREAVSLISPEELSEFDRYLGRLDTTMPMTDPTLYQNRGMSDLSRARARVGLIRRIKQQVEESDGGTD